MSPPLRRVRAALTQTVNAYPDMPARVEDLHLLADRLPAVRRANLDHHVTLIERARSAGAQIICLGELFPGPYFALGRDPMWLALAEDARTGESVSRMRETARRSAMIIIAPIFELDPSGRRFNTAVVIDERGELLGKYRKTHIPVGANEQGGFHETFYYDRSDGGNGKTPANVSANPFFPVFQTSLGRIGVATCYDRHFEGVMWSLAKEGAEVVFSPAVTFGGKSQRMWRVEFQADAARHNLFIGGSNRRGVEPPWNQPYFGDSHFVGPNGPCHDLSANPHLVIADLDLAELSSGDPSGWNLPRDIRHDIYSGRR